METTIQKTQNPDPSALGLFGLALITLVASSQKLGITTGTAFVIPWALFLGGMAQIVAGWLDYKKNNVFGATAFLGYGFFWLAVATSWMMNLNIFGDTTQSNIDVSQLGFAFVGYLIFTLIMTIGAMETNKVLFIIFVLIDFLFVGLSLSTLGIAKEFGHDLAAYSELAISLLSFYAMAANVLSIHFGYQFLPVGKPFGIFKKQ